MGLVFYCNILLIQFNIYFNHHLHIFMLNYFTYIVHVRARKITKFVAYLPCMCTERNTDIVRRLGLWLYSAGQRYSVRVYQTASRVLVQRRIRTRLALCLKF